MRVMMVTLTMLLAFMNSVALAAVHAQLEALVAEALTANPEIHGSEAEWQMLRERAKATGTFDDPMVMLKIQNGMISDPLAFDQDPTTAKVLGVSQMFPFFGKRGLQRDAAEKAAEAARWSLEERKLQLRRMVVEAWARLAYVETSLKLIEKNLVLLDDSGRLAEASYRSGMGKQPDILRVQIERSRMEEMKYGFLQQQRSLQAMFMALLHRDEPAAVAVTAGSVQPVTLTAAELQELALQSRPELMARSVKIDKADDAERLARREYYPDFTLSFEYMQRDAFTSSMATSNGEDMYSAAISFNLPLQLGKRQAMVAEAQQEKRLAVAEVDGLRHEIHRSIVDLLAQLEGSASMARLYHEGLLPQEEFAVESTLASFRAGKAEFMAVLDSQMKLFADQQKYAVFVAEHQMLRAQLEATVGTQLP